MNREEIFKKSRMENKEEDEREKNLRLKGGIPFIIAFAIAFLFFTIFEILFFDSYLIRQCFGTTLWFCGTVEMWYITIGIKRKASWYIFTSYFTLNFILNVITFIIYLKEIM